MLNISIMRGSKGPFRLRMLSNGLYQIHSHHGPAFEGPKLKIFMRAVRLGVRRADLRLAVKEMFKMGHDYADFGIGGGFLFTGKGSKSKAA